MQHSDQYTDQNIIEFQENGGTHVIWFRINPQSGTSVFWSEKVENKEQDGTQRIISRSPFVAPYLRGWVLDGDGTYTLVLMSPQTGKTVLKRELAYGDRLLGLFGHGAEPELAWLVVSQQDGSIAITDIRYRLKGDAPGFDVSAPRHVPTDSALPILAGTGRGQLGAPIVRVDWTYLPGASTLMFIHHRPVGDMLWPLDLAVGRFGDAITPFGPSPRTTYRSGTPNVSWAHESLGHLMVWPESRSQPISVSGLRVGSNDELDFSQSFDRAVVVRADARDRFELWRLDHGAGTASLLTAATLSDHPQTFLSPDNRLVLAQRAGGHTHAWHAETGESLGYLGVFAGSSLWTEYRHECLRLLRWTDEGQRIELRRGYAVPILGFFPERACPPVPPTRQ